ncbi:hypothetical protein BCR36DRAFT_579499 [Piromyces finnis]|uniref:Uncharacterized protein n=1 Tax=Piromyces finnis TaxID=1754191 RepID=A0A1Y1VMC9_9FUNG|nr:hypothetical protein BCR36DRAFT_579499 [Piromyces finnis]|eukprot:ORX60058.1 hypothetical protein BCR36DRAFT_579499 [Piromyces finnis]
MHITVSLLFSIILYNTFISEFFAYSITTREKRDIINKRLKYIRTKRAPIDNSYHCDEDNCKLPKCKCFSENNPGSLKTKDIPQFVLISIDGSLTNKSIKYQNQITENVMSPNGCPAMITNFATDENSDFFEIESAYVKNNEIAFNLNETESKIITPKMVNSLRDLVEKFTNIDKKEIIGFRYTGNERLKVNIYHDICDLEYLYDSSFSISPLNNFWPFTLDYGIPTEFNSKSLISGVYPELWEIPIYELLNPDNSTFAIWEPNVSSNGKLLEILKNNFLNLHYNNNRIPFTMPLTKQWLEQDKRIETINEFLKWIVDETNNDTYFINYSQLIEWMKNPVKLDNINKSGIFKCENNRKISCKNPNLCLYKSASFKTCKECPIQNPYLEANLDDIPELSSECNKKVPEDGCGNGVWECGCQCLNNDNNLDGYCLDEFGKCTIPKVYKENVGYICENQ